jgi:methionine synthase II (cobalamin-independent)
MQQKAGLQSATDGEFRRATWHMDFIYQIGGIGKAPGNIAVTFHNAQGDIEWTPAAIHVDRKISPRPALSAPCRRMGPCRCRTGCCRPGRSSPILAGA